MKKNSIILIAGLFASACTYNEKPTPSSSERGKQVAFTFELGNCLACHKIAEGDSPGNIGPELKNLASRYQDKAQLRRFIWDATQFNPNTSMPPFGKNNILSEKDINALVDYLWDLQ